MLPQKKYAPENVVYVQMEFYTVIKKTKIMPFAEKMDETGGHNFEQNKLDSERKVLDVFSHM